MPFGDGTYQRPRSFSGRRMGYCAGFGVLVTTLGAYWGGRVVAGA